MSQRVSSLVGHLHSLPVVEMASPQQTNGAAPFFSVLLFARSFVHDFDPFLGSDCGVFTLAVMERAVQLVGQDAPSLDAMEHFHVDAKSWRSSALERIDSWRAEDS